MRVRLKQDVTKYRIRANAQEFSEGDPVDTPDGLGVVVEVRDEDFDGPDGAVEASEDNVAYVVGLEDESIGAAVFRAGQLEDTELPETDVEEPIEDVKEDNDTSSNSVTANDWTMPDSWVESEKPARLILLDAWASLGAQFDCGGACCMGELRSRRLCAAMKDEVLLWEGWRN